MFCNSANLTNMVITTRSTVTDGPPVSPTKQQQKIFQKQLEDKQWYEQQLKQTSEIMIIRSLRRRLWKAFTEEDSNNALFLYKATRKDWEQIMMQEFITEQQQQGVGKNKLKHQQRKSRFSRRKSNKTDIHIPMETILKEQEELDDYDIDDDGSDGRGLLEIHLNPSDPFITDDFKSPYGKYEETKEEKKIKRKQHRKKKSNHFQQEQRRRNNTQRQAFSFFGGGNKERRSRSRSSSNDSSAGDDILSIDSIEIIDQQTTTPLHEAARIGNPDLVRCMLQHVQADCDVRNGLGRTVLHCATGGLTSIEEFYLLQERTGSEENKTKQDNNNNEKEDTDNNNSTNNTKIGIRAPIPIIDPTSSNNQKVGRVQRAARVVGRMMFRDKNKMKKHKSTNQSSKDDDNSEYSVTMSPTERGIGPEELEMERLEIIHAILMWSSVPAARAAALVDPFTTTTSDNVQMTVSTNAVDTVLGRTALHYAAELGRNEMCRTILDSFYGTMLTVIDCTGQTPCELASDTGHTDLAAYLEARALLYVDPYGTDEDLLTAINNNNITSTSTSNNIGNNIPPFCWFETLNIISVQEQRTQRINDARIKMISIAAKHRVRQHTRRTIAEYGKQKSLELSSSTSNTSNDNNSSNNNNNSTTPVEETTAASLLLKMSKSISSEDDDNEVFFDAPTFEVGGDSNNNNKPEKTEVAAAAAAGVATTTSDENDEFPDVAAAAAADVIAGNDDGLDDEQQQQLIMDDNPVLVLGDDDTDSDTDDDDDDDNSISSEEADMKPKAIETGIGQNQNGADTINETDVVNKDGTNSPENNDTNNINEDLDKDYSVFENLLHEAQVEQFLIYHEWDVKKAMEAFFDDPFKSFESASIMLPAKTGNKEDDGANDDNERICLICCDEFEPDSTEWKSLTCCNHGFCIDCLHGYVDNCARSRSTGFIISCPHHECESLLTPTEISEFASSESIVQSLEKAANESFVASGKDLKFCPHPGCEHVVKLNPPTQSSMAKITESGLLELVGAVCTRGKGCSEESKDALAYSYEGMWDPSYFDLKNQNPTMRAHRFCFKCSEPKMHWPVRCDILKKWQETIDEQIGAVQEGESNADGGGGKDSFEDVAQRLWMKANTRPCPKCNAPIQKNDGCNHMSCSNPSCKHEFCWICRKDWKLHNTETGGFFKCNRWVEEEEHDYYDKNAKKDVPAPRDEDIAPIVNRVVVDPNVNRVVEDPTDPRTMEITYGTAMHESRAAKKKSREMARFLHHYERWYGHLSSGALEREMADSVGKRLAPVVKEAIAFNGNEYVFGGKGLSFLHDAFTELLECRSMLQHSYAFSFFRYKSISEKKYKLVRHVANEKTRFEQYQSELELMTEQISDMIARSHIRATQTQITFLTAATAEKRKDFSNVMVNILLEEESESSGKKHHRHHHHHHHRRHRHHHRHNHRRSRNGHGGGRRRRSSSTSDSDDENVVAVRESLENFLARTGIGGRHALAMMTGDRDSSDDGRDWACSSCTFVNSGGNRCSMCSSYR